MNKSLWFQPLLSLLTVLWAGNAVHAQIPTQTSTPAPVRIVPKTLVGTKGFFRVGQATDGYWWLVAPDNEPFFYRGVTAVNRAGTPGGRRAKPGPYADTIDRKYGYASAGPEAFVRAEIARLRQWGFNALGAWTTDEFFDHGMPYTEIVEFNYLGPSLRPDNVPNATVDLPDVFDPVWERAADEKAKLICAPRRDSHDLIGYFTDNELGWAQPEGEDVDNNPKEALDPAGHLTLLQQCLSLPPDRAAFRAAWEFVRKRHGGGNDGEALARAWNLPTVHEADVAAWTRAGRALVSAGYRADSDAFSGIVAHRYFETTGRLIRKYDPHHLLLGCRFGGPPGKAILAEYRRPFVDVLSANNYRDTMYERMEVYYTATKLPLLIGEFSWASDYFSRVLPPDNGSHADPDATNGLPMPERMLRRGEATLQRAATHPGMVGYTWYRWDSKSDPTHPEKIPYGLVDLNDDPHRLHTDVLTRLNPRLFERHRKAALLQGAAAAAVSRRHADSPDATVQSLPK